MKEQKQPVVTVVDSDSSSVSSVQQGLKRNLKPRHVNFIALGGSLGVGLLIGSGGALAIAGPVGMLISYALMGVITMCTIFSLAEMCAYLGREGNFIEIMARFIDKSTAFAFTWSNALSFSLTLPSEISSICLLIGFWDTDKKLPDWATVLIFTFIIIMVNIVDVGAYGEVEFWVTMIKLILFVGSIFFCLIATCGGNPLHKTTGFQYWRNPGPFVNYLTDKPVGKFLGVWRVLVNAAFGYQGSETIGLASGETPNFRKLAPAVMKSVAIRVVTFNVLSLFMVSLMVASNDPNLLSAINAGAGNGAQSPFVIAVENAGVKVLPSIVNGGILIAAFSAANTQIYIPSRSYYYGTKYGFCPKWLIKTNRNGVPYYSVLFNGAFGLLALLTLNNTAAQVFNWLMNLVTEFGFICWALINYAFLRYYYGLKRQGIDRSSIPIYKSPLQPYSAIFACFMLVLVAITQGFTAFIPWDTQNFFAAYISLILYFVFWLGYKLWTRDFREIPLDKIDFSYPEDEEDLEYDNKTAKVMDKIFC
ncbi:uncharacterized protein OGAPODRAFT_13497 [Ogataea polymorpha]|uniref:uncharacterized protein n=1 Tax=Ogataea polymorpha TaxID=460523 RepID=UPI0007F461B6|nr:uncharacterized protein OGAPODRAFT_13497 [Ogataea polymorpha]KAG7913634.1 hypothetical protein KL927_005220 [Ogataea polymorpha]KAG7930113.1 hypothetical protein KL934_005225 [Ogataea polymorpha]OBA16109.1 hypothetical protein OGAPODRAFT_13497 [Ogataea polymorpha]